MQSYNNNSKHLHPPAATIRGSPFTATKVPPPPPPVQIHCNELHERLVPSKQLIINNVSILTCTT